MIFTHKKKTYFATCLQWNGSNTKMVMHILERAGCNVSVYGDQLKIMKNAEFTMKYEAVV